MEIFFPFQWISTYKEKSVSAMTTKNKCNQNKVVKKYRNIKSFFFFIKELIVFLLILLKNIYTQTHRSFEERHEKKKKKSRGF